MSGCSGRWHGTRRSGRCDVGQGLAALYARSQRALLTALSFAFAWQRKLATPASDGCCFKHSSPLLAAAAASQQERYLNSALITLLEPPSPGRVRENHRPEKKR